VELNCSWNELEGSSHTRPWATNIAVG